MGGVHHGAPPLAARATSRRRRGSSQGSSAGGKVSNDRLAQHPPLRILVLPAKSPGLEPSLRRARFPISRADGRRIHDGGSDDAMGSERTASCAQGGQKWL